MSIYDAYRARVGASGASMQDAVKNTTKRQAINYIMSSPTLSYVRLNDDVDLTPVVESDKETFQKRIYLFLPDTVINVGDYIHQSNNAIYLATDQDKDDIYPQLIGELCNEFFELVTEATKVIIGYNDFNRPIYRNVGAQTYLIPCVLTSKIYSTIDNSAIPLPEGSLMIRMSYDPLKIPPINYVFTYRGSPYKVNTISYENVVKEVGFVEMRLERITGGVK